MPSAFDRIGLVQDKTTPKRTPLSELPPIYRLDELIEKDDFPACDSFMAGELLTKGDICLVAGRRKVGKTYLVLHKTGCLAGGTPFGALETRPARILYFSQEMSEKAIHRRLKRLYTPDAYRRICTNFHIICKVKFTLDTPEGAAILLGILQDAIGRDEPYDGIVIDALRDVKGVYRESDNDEMGQLMVRLRDDVLLPANVFCILIHHMGKPNQEGENRGGRGASVIEDVVAEAVYLERIKGQTKRRGVFAITREGDLEETAFLYEIVSDPETSAVQVLVEEDKDGGETAEEDLDVAQLAEWVNAQDIDVTVPDVMKRFSYGRSSAYTKVKRAVRLRMIEKRGNGYGPKRLQDIG